MTLTAKSNAKLTVGITLQGEPTVLQYQRAEASENKAFCPLPSGADPRWGVLLAIDPQA
jgi:hypothetical protein